MKFTVVKESLGKNNPEMFCSREKSTEIITMSLFSYINDSYDLNKTIDIYQLKSEDLWL